MRLFRFSPRWLIGFVLAAGVAGGLVLAAADWRVLVLIGAGMVVAIALRPGVKGLWLRALAAALGLVPGVAASAVIFGHTVLKGLEREWGTPPAPWERPFVWGLIISCPMVSSLAFVIWARFFLALRARGRAERPEHSPEMSEALMDALAAAVIIAICLGGLYVTGWRALGAGA